MLKGCLTMIGVGMVVMLVLGWWLFFGSITPPVMFNCRLTLDVATPQGERVGSGVVQIYREYRSAADRSLGYFATTITRGDAVSVDLGALGPVFVVFVNDPDRYDPQNSNDYIGDAYVRLVLAIFPLARFHGVWPEGKVAEGDNEIKAKWKAYADELKRVKPKADVSLEDLPMIVRFRKIDDPASIERVNPKNFEATLGKGVTLERATLEITDDPVTRVIERKLPWLSQSSPATSFDIPIYRRSPEQNLTEYDFRSFSMPSQK